MWRRILISLILPCFGCCAPTGPAIRSAPNPSATAANQLAVAGNACGPAALLNAFRFGNPKWQRASNAVAGASDRERMLRIIRELGMRPSGHMTGRARWTRRGVSVADLKDIANDMTRSHFLPQLEEEVFFLKPGETPPQLLRRVHRRLETSLANGLPPVLSIRRYARRGGGGKAAEWVVLDAHFVTITSLPRRLEKSATSFQIGYIDPWGGKRCEGSIGLPKQALFIGQNGDSLCLEAVFPQTSVGGKLMKKGESSVLAVSAAVGRW
jgi:hypothetical protein